MSEKPERQAPNVALEEQRSRTEIATRARVEIAHQGIRGLLIVNGGAAIALLAFLQAMWTTAPPNRGLMEHILFGLTFLSAGVALATLASWLRYHTSLAYQDERPGKSFLNIFSWTVTYASWLMFPLAMGWVIVGARASLP